MQAPSLEETLAQLKLTLPPNSLSPTTLELLARLDSQLPTLTHHHSQLTLELAHKYTQLLQAQKQLKKVNSKLSKKQEELEAFQH